jgi:hypothetical protein
MLLCRKNCSAGPLFPSTSFRRTPVLVPSGLQLEEHLQPLEKTGVTKIDITLNEMKFQIFAWRQPEKLEAIDNLRPIATFTCPVRS